MHDAAEHFVFEQKLPVLRRVDHCRLDQLGAGCQNANARQQRREVK